MTNHTYIYTVELYYFFYILSKKSTLTVEKRSFIGCPIQLKNGIKTKWKFFKKRSHWNANDTNNHHLSRTSL